MKLRFGFVSNSSSASFTIKKRLLTTNQKIMLLLYTSSNNNIDGWNIIERPEDIRGYTPMDNGHINELFSLLLIDEQNINWEDYS